MGSGRVNFGLGPAIRRLSISTFFSVLDRGTGNPPVNQGGEEVRLNAEGAFGHNFRGVANIDYLSSYVFRLAFNDVFTQAVNSEVKSKAFLSNTTNGFFYNASMQRYQDFESTTAGDVVTILHAPSFEVSSVDRQLGPSPFYWSYEAAAEGLNRSEPGFSTAALVGRFDLQPSISLPLKLGGLVVPSGVRASRYRLYRATCNRWRNQSRGIQSHQSLCSGRLGGGASSGIEPHLRSRIHGTQVEARH